MGISAMGLPNDGHQLSNEKKLVVFWFLQGIFNCYFLGFYDIFMMQPFIMIPSNPQQVFSWRLVWAQTCSVGANSMWMVFT